MLYSFLDTQNAVDLSMAEDTGVKVVTCSAILVYDYYRCHHVQSLNSIVRWGVLISVAMDYHPVGKLMS